MGKLLSIALFISFICSAGYFLIKGAEAVFEKTHDDFTTNAQSVGISFTDNSYTLRYEWGVEMTASVEPNECNTCVSYCRTDECKLSCYNFYCK